MPGQYGGIYRHPPAPQRAEPSAILPAEAFPDPPFGSPGRSIMSVIDSHWRIGAPPPQRARPTAILAVEVFDNPPITDRGSLLAVLAQSWQPTIHLQPPAARIVQAVDVVAFLPFTRDRVAVGSWLALPTPQRARPTAILPELFDNPPVDTRARAQILELINGVWRLRNLPAPERHYPSAILPAQAFDDPPLGYPAGLVLPAILEQYLWVPPPQRHVIVVTEEGVLLAVVLAPPDVVDAPPRRWKVDAEVRRPAVDAPPRTLLTDDH